MYTFYATIHARPSAAVAGPTLELQGRQMATVAVAPELLSTTTFNCTFEEAADALRALERLYCELDGSFVWVSRQGEPPWQVDGNLYDRQERLLFVDIKGTCPPAEFDRLLRAIGWPETPVMFQLVREAVLLEEMEFRRHAKQ
jgi:hypothetical protein